MPHLTGIQQIVGQSAWTLKLRKRILQVAGYNYNVLIIGAPGAGKEFIAQAIHAHGPRSIKPFVRVNCAALPGELFGRQAFGQVAGEKKNGHATLGCFRAAEGGTLLLDEVGDLDLDQQERLLRAIDEKSVLPVGGAERVPVDVRLVATTDRNLDDEVRAGRFRLDLYYRLNVISLFVAPLRDRREDIPALARHFLARAAVEHGVGVKDLTPAAVDLLQNYDWPGNLREMRALIERAALFGGGSMIGPESFPEVAAAIGLSAPGGAKLSHSAGRGDDASGSGADESRERATIGARRRRALGGRRGAFRTVASSADSSASNTAAAVLADVQTAGPSDAWPTLSDIERGHIARTLEETFFNQSAAARLLGINRKLLSRKMKKHGIRLPGKAG